MIPATQAVGSLLALKLIGAERKSHVMDLVMDQAIAMFAGINVVPKRSYLADYSSRIDHRACLRLRESWLEQVEQAHLAHGSSFDLDFHSALANSAEAPLEKHYVSSRSRSQKGFWSSCSRRFLRRFALCHCWRHQERTGRRDSPVCTVFRKSILVNCPLNWCSIRK